jgi:hypothetical protein
VLPADPSALAGLDESQALHALPTTVSYMHDYFVHVAAQMEQLHNMVGGSEWRRKRRESCVREQAVQVERCMCVCVCVCVWCGSCIACTTALRAHRCVLRAPLLVRVLCSTTTTACARAVFYKHHCLCACCVLQAPLLVRVLCSTSATACARAVFYEHHCLCACCVLQAPLLVHVLCSTSTTACARAVFCKHNCLCACCVLQAQLLVRVLCSTSTTACARNRPGAAAAHLGGWCLGVCLGR